MNVLKPFIIILLIAAVIVAGIQYVETKNPNKNNTITTKETPRKEVRYKNLPVAEIEGSKATPEENLKVIKELSKNIYATDSGILNYEKNTNPD